MFTFLFSLPTAKVGVTARKITAATMGKELGKESSPLSKDLGSQERFHRGEISRKRSFPMAVSP